MDTRELNRSAAAKISTVLKSQSKSLAWLSRTSEIPYPTLKRVMSGEARLTLGMLGTIAVALGVPVTQLLSEGFLERARTKPSGDASA
ncbi:MAG: helix-turn-helix domain-containing protein [Bifidobacteriaceae bacterium]|jgi:lambda repressor-like predicted transcriptional regulator|nr:helix-turn-helix domain-containing protein [Bifidobacteriaceae bacterium]